MTTRQTTTRAIDAARLPAVYQPGRVAAPALWTGLVVCESIGMAVPTAPRTSLQPQHSPNNPVTTQVTIRAGLRPGRIRTPSVTNPAANNAYTTAPPIATPAIRPGVTGMSAGS